MNDCTASPTGKHERRDTAGDPLCKHCGAPAFYPKHDDTFTEGVPRDPAFLSGWLYVMAEGDALTHDDARAVRYAAELLGDMAGVTRHGNARRRNLAGASLRTRQEEPTMSQQWPDPNDPNTPNPQPIQTPPTEAPGAPHTPESPRQTPEPGDDDGGSEPA